MARDRFIPKREILPDIRYNNILISKFINVMMLEGKKTVSQSIMYDALENCEKKLNKTGVEIEQAFNARPLVEVKS